MNIELIIKDERLPRLLAGHESEPPTASVEARWWNLAKLESAVVTSIDQAEAQLSQLRRKLDRLQGGREVVEAMLLASIGPTELMLVEASEEREIEAPVQ